MGTFKIKIWRQIIKRHQCLILASSPFQSILQEATALTHKRSRNIQKMLTVRLNNYSSLTEGLTQGLEDLKWVFKQSAVSPIYSSNQLLKTRMMSTTMKKKTKEKKWKKNSTIYKRRPKMRLMSIALAPFWTKSIPWWRLLSHPIWSSVPLIITKSSGTKREKKLKNLEHPSSLLTTSEKQTKLSRKV